MKLLEDSFSYANQLGARQGAGAVYLSAHHPDILRFLDTKRENADEKIRIKTLSLGVVVPDITSELAKNDEDMRSEEHTSELQSLMRISYAVHCLKKKNKTENQP